MQTARLIISPRLSVQCRDLCLASRGLIRRPICTLSPFSNPLAGTGEAVMEEQDYHVEAYDRPCTSEEYLRSRASGRSLPLALQLATSANFHRRERVLVLLSFGVSLTLSLCRLSLSLLAAVLAVVGAGARGKSFPSSLGLLDDLDRGSKCWWTDRAATCG